jgi:hypothetical protein
MPGGTRVSWWTWVALICLIELFVIVKRPPGGWDQTDEDHADVI